MADPDPDKAQVKKATVEKVLTGLFDRTDIRDFQNVPGVKFYNPENKSFQAYKDFGNVILTEKNISQVSITVDGKERYFKKIVQNDATGDKIDGVTNKSVDKSASGLKATAWMETDKDGQPIDKEGKPLTAGGKAEIYLAFPGFKGDPTSKTSQTQAALAAEQGQLYTSASQVEKFLETVNQKLQADGMGDANMHITAHSFGSPTAIAAAGILGDKVKDVFLLDPVTASGTLDLLKAMSPDELVEKLGVTKEQAIQTAENIKRIEDKTTSRRSVDEGGRLSNAAMLEVFQGDAKDPNNRQALEDLHKRNMGSGTSPTFMEKAKLVLPETLFTAKTGRDGNDPNKVDPKNRMIGKKEYEFVSKKVIEENGLTSLANKFDPIHAIANSVAAEQKGTPTAPTVEKLKEKIEAFNKSQETKKPAPDMTSKDERGTSSDMAMIASLDATMTKALEQFGLTPKEIAGAVQNMEKFVQNGLSDINGMVESMGMQTTLAQASEAINKAAKGIADVGTKVTGRNV